jgi:N-carbamoyl-L-amino-acid hydrolase
MIFNDSDRVNAQRIFENIAARTADPQGGIDRASYGRGETRALAELLMEANKLGVYAGTDHADNLVMSLEQSLAVTRDKVTVIGSHLDSVPRGGNYDGLAGVVAALLILGKARERGVTKPLRGVGLRGEESAWFGVPHLGAKAMLGKLSLADLALIRRGDPEATLARCMGSCGAEIGKVESGYRSFEPASIEEYWELHIEQGPVLAERQIPVGIVTNIRGHARTTTARVIGEAAHSGTTPMGNRKDAVRRFCALVTMLAQTRKRMAVRDVDIVFTIGTVNTDPARHSVTTVADEVKFSLDVRSVDPTVPQLFLEQAKEHGMDTDGEAWLDLGSVRYTAPISLSRRLMTRASMAAHSLGIVPMELPSGAGHDAGVFADAGVPTGMIFVRNYHGSHNPQEEMHMDDFMRGLEVLWATVIGS